MLFITVFIILLLVVTLFVNTKVRLTPRGILMRNKTATVNSNTYLTQEFTFKTYKKAHAEYFKIVSEIEKTIRF